MANLIVTFSHGGPVPPHSSSLPVMSATKIRSEAVVIGAGNDVSNIECEEGENIVHLHAEADCYVALGENPVAEAIPAASTETDAVACIAMDSGDKLQLWVPVGYKVAVITKA